MIKFVIESERVPGFDEKANPELTPLLGIWKNTNIETDNVLKVEFYVFKNQLMFKAFGAAESGLTDWGAVACAAFSGAVDSVVVSGLSANYDFGFKKTLVVGNIKQGVLVLQVYHSYNDKSGRANYFSREFYHRISPGK